MEILMGIHLERQLEISLVMPLDLPKVYRSVLVSVVRWADSVVELGVDSVQKLVNR